MQRDQRAGPDGTSPGRQARSLMPADEPLTAPPEGGALRDGKRQDPGAPAAPRFCQTGGTELRQCERQRPGRAQRADDAQRHRGHPAMALSVGVLAGDAGTAGKINAFRSGNARVRPPGEPEAGQPGPGNKTSRGPAAGVPDPAGPDGQMIGVGRVARETKCQVGEHRCGQVAGAPRPCRTRPAAVWLLQRPDALGRGAGKFRRPDAEKFPDQHSLGVDGDISGLAASTSPGCPGGRAARGTRAALPLRPLRAAQRPPQRRYWSYRAGQARRCALRRDTARRSAHRGAGRLRAG